MQHIVYDIGRMSRVKTINWVKQREKTRTFGALHKRKDYNNESNNIICKMLQLSSLFQASFAIYKFCFTLLCSRGSTPFWGHEIPIIALSSLRIICAIATPNRWLSHSPSLSLFLSLSLLGSWAIEKSNFQSICWLACSLQQFHLHSHIYNM